MICNVCGKKFKVGNSPISGLPNGIGMQFGTDEIFNVCSTCMCYRKNKVVEVCEQWKKERGID